MSWSSAQAELLRGGDSAVQFLRRYGEGVLSCCVRQPTVTGASGRVYDAIEQEAVRWPAGLVVIGTHGRRGFRRLVLGSVAEGLIRITSKPVLSVRATGPWVS